MSGGGEGQGGLMRGDLGALGAHGEILSGEGRRKLRKEFRNHVTRHHLRRHDFRM